MLELLNIVTRISQKKVPIPDGLSHNQKLVILGTVSNSAELWCSREQLQTFNLFTARHCIIWEKTTFISKTIQLNSQKTVFMQSHCAHAIILQCSIVQLKTVLELLHLKLFGYSDQRYIPYGIQTA